MLKRWKRLASQLVRQNPWWSYRLDRFEIPGGYRGEYHYVHTNGSSMVLALSADNRLLLVNQYRYLCERESLEFPCGSVKASSTHLDTARHELAEEGGLEAGRIEPLAAFNPYNGVTDEICQIFLATELAPASARPDATEEFELRRCTPAELDEMIAGGGIWDGMTLAAWALCRHSVLQRL